MQSEFTANYNNRGILVTLHRRPAASSCNSEQGKMLDQKAWTLVDLVIWAMENNTTMVPFEYAKEKQVRRSIDRLLCQRCFGGQA